MRRVLVALALALVVGGAGNRADVAGAQDTEVIHLAAAPFEAAGDAYYAQEMGFFKQNGLNVDLQTINTGAATLAAVVGGSIQVGGGNPLPVAQARQRGLKVTFIAPGYIYDWANPPGSALVVATGSALKSAKSLTGKTIAVTANPSIDVIAAAAWLDANGGDSSSVKYIEVPPSTMSDAVASGRVDAAVIGVPALTSGVDSGKVQILARCYDAIGRHVMVTGWFTTDDWAAKHPNEVRRFQVAINQAAAWAVQNPELAAGVLTKYLKLSMTRAHEYHARSLDPNLLQPMLDGAFRYKMLNKPMSASEIFWKS